MKTTPRAYALVLLVLLTRAALVLLQGAPPIEMDAAQRDDIARNLVGGHGFAFSAPMLYPWQSEDDPRPKPTARTMPAYPLLLAGLYGLGLGPISMLWLHVLFAALTAWIVYRLALHFGASERVGLMAVALYLVYPPLWKSNLVLGSETLFILLFLGSLTLFLRAMKGGGLAVYGISGVLLGLATLTRPVTLVFPFALAPFVLWRGRGAATGWAVFTIVSVLTVSPWAVRNLVVFDQLEFSTTNKGWNLYVGTNPASFGRPELPPEERSPALLESWVGRSEFAVDSINRAAALENLQAPPQDLAMLIVAKMIRLWIRTDLEPHFPIPSMKGLLFDLPILLLGLAGLWTMIADRRAYGWMPMVVVAFVAAAHAVSVATFRFNIMAMPLIMIGVAIMADRVVALAMRKLGRASAAADTG
jgi:4-amino-4-deoxy-L-arabinose transferase-like glycosyltransferase